MAFESLTDRLSGIIKKLKGNSTLTESNMQDMLKEIRIALLEADVNFLVAKEFVNNVKEKALGQEVLKKLNPSQMVVKIVHDELVELLGADQSEIKYNSNKPTIIMLCGLQGSGKTTTAAKLANGITDTPVLMAAKSHLRNGRPVIIAISTNDALGINLQNIGKLMVMKHIYFVPFGQDDAAKKPNSCVADMTKIAETVEYALAKEQIQPVLL